MLMIRLQRVGRKHEPVFRLVLTDSKNSPKSGRFLEILGSYDARRAEKAVFNNDKVKEWMSKGAKLSDTVHNLLVERKVVSGKKINNLPKKRPTATEKTEESAASTATVETNVPAEGSADSEPINTETEATIEAAQEEAKAE